MKLLAVIYGISIISIVYHLFFQGKLLYLHSQNEDLFLPIPFFLELIELIAIISMFFVNWIAACAVVLVVLSNHFFTKQDAWLDRLTMIPMCYMYVYGFKTCVGGF